MSVGGPASTAVSNNSISVIIFPHCRGKHVHLKELKTLCVTNGDEKVQDAIKRMAKDWNIDFSYDIFTPRRELIGHQPVRHFIRCEIHVVRRSSNKRKDPSDSGEESSVYSSPSFLVPPPSVSIANQQDANAFNVQTGSNVQVSNNNNQHQMKIRNERLKARFERLDDSDEQLEKMTNPKNPNCEAHVVRKLVSYLDSVAYLSRTSRRRGSCCRQTCESIEETFFSLE